MAEATPKRNVIYFPLRRKRPGGEPKNEDELQPGRGAVRDMLIPVILLIIIGGIGFLTWKDVSEHKFRLRRYRMQSKVVLVTTAVLIVIPALLLLAFEYTEGSVTERVFLSLFQAVTPRTAGFNTADISALSGAGSVLLIMLMMIGGSPGSTAGGMKTTPAAVLLANADAVFRRKKNVQLFGRRIEDVLAVTENGSENLSTITKELLIV